MTKRQRQDAILALVSEHVVANQEELRRLLKERGVVVTQATLSRDLHELGVARVPTEDGVRYTVPGGADPAAKAALETLMPQLFVRVAGVGEMIVLHTLPSGAQPIAEGIDAQGWPEVLGTIGGDNTILIICRSAGDREALTRRLERMAGR